MKATTARKHVYRYFEDQGIEFDPDGIHLNARLRQKIIDNTGIEKKKRESPMMYIKRVGQILHDANYRR